MNRREALAGLCAAGFGGILAACGTGTAESSSSDRSPTTAPSTTAAPTTTAPMPLAGRFDAVGTCALTPHQIAGPSYVAVDAIRRDLREDRPGSPLRVGLRVLGEACVPVRDAAVELWNCDAQGLYSALPQRTGDTTGLTFCRGTQVTAGDGVVDFLTIYPGWYRTRTPHLHVRVSLGNAEVLTSQLYFDDEVTAQVFAAEPYLSHTGRDTFNESDHMFDPSTLVALSPEAEGHLALLNVGIRRA